MKISYEKNQLCLGCEYISIALSHSFFSCCFKLHFAWRRVSHSHLPWPLSALCRWPAGTQGRSGSDQPVSQWKLRRSCWRHRHLELLGAQHSPRPGSAQWIWSSGRTSWCMPTHPLLQGLTTPGRSCLASLATVFCSCQQPLRSMPESHPLLHLAVRRCLEVLRDTGLWRSLLGLHPTSWAGWRRDFECEMQPPTWRMRNAF